MTLSSVADPKIVRQGTPLRRAELKSHYDAIVVGSGMGGLTAAVGLAKFGGQQVLVLEQHTTAGGFTHTFKRGRFAWNVGVHYLGGGIGERGNLMHTAFDAFTGGRVAWAKLPEVRERVFVGDRVYDIVSGRQAWLDKMTEYFPKERQALVKFVKLAGDAMKAFVKADITRLLPGWLARLVDPLMAKDWHDLATTPLHELLEDLTQDKELQAVLAAHWPDMGIPPGRASAGFYLVVYNHYLDGAYIPAGGSSTFAAAMIPAIEAAGGAVVTSADVAQIVVRQGRAVGVKLADGREITSNVVISNAGLRTTYSNLLPPDVLANSPEMQEQLQQAAAAGGSPATVCLYLGLNEPVVREFEGVGTLRVFDSADHDTAEAMLREDEPPELPPVEICCVDGREIIMPGAAAAAASIKGSQLPKGLGVSTLQVITFASYDHFKRWGDTQWHRRGEEYEAFKQQYQEKLMKRLGLLFPDLPGRVAYTELSTPLTVEHFNRWPEGGIYGIGLTPERFKLTKGLSWGPITPLPGLLLTGQDTVGNGVVLAWKSGILAAQLAGGPRVSLWMGKEIAKSLMADLVAARGG